MPLTDITRICTICKTEKPITEFVNHRNEKYGKGYRCLICHRIISRRDYKKHRDYYLNYGRNYERDEKEIRNRHPERVAARKFLNHSIESGRIVKPYLCQKCNLKTKIGAHHHKGYAKEYWLDVQWLCKACHGLVHRISYIS